MIYVGYFVGALVLLAALGAAYLFFWDWRRSFEEQLLNRQLDWHPYQAGLDIMRRVGKGGLWEYRAMTDAEYRTHMMDPWG